MYYFGPKINTQPQPQPQQQQQQQQQTLLAFLLELEFKCETAFRYILSKQTQATNIDTSALGPGSDFWFLHGY